MGGLYSPFKVYTPGEVLTAADLNATDQNHITNQTPQMSDDYSADLTQARLQSDPGSGLATSLAIEIQQLRFALAKIAGKTYWNEITGSAFASTTGPSGISVGQLRGLVTGDTSTLNLKAAYVTFSGGSFKVDVDVTLNISTAGPAVNGRDQSGDFSNEWVNVWFIYEPDTSNVGLIATKTVSVKTPPTLPPGYTEYCYATTVRVGATNKFLKAGLSGQVQGSHFMYMPTQQVVTLGFSSTEIAVDIGSLVPTDRIAGCTYRLYIEGLSGHGTGGSIGHAYIRVYTTVNYLVYFINQPYASGAVFGVQGMELTMPVVGVPNFLYQFARHVGETFFQADVMGYRVPNGDV